MAEDRDGWQELAAKHNQDITRAFRELRQRWQAIFDQEQLRWNAAVHQYQYRQQADGRWAHDWVAKSPAEQAAGMRQAVQAMREATDTRLPWEAYGGYGSYMSGPHPARRGLVAREEWRHDLAEASLETLAQRLVDTEALQREYPHSDYHYWDLREEATQLRETLAQRRAQGHDLRQPQAWIAAEAARLRAEQRSTEHVREAAKKDYSFGH